MKFLFAFAILLSIYQLAYAETARAVFCGAPADSKMSWALTEASSEVSGFTGNAKEVDAMAEIFVNSRDGSFGNVVGKKVVLLKPYRVVNIVKNDNAICAIYSGTVVKTKVLTKDDASDY
jgi:hypothetical protein